jgi:hypothetical protein
LFFLALSHEFSSVASRVLLATSFHAGFLLGLFCDPEDGGDELLDSISVGNFFTVE